MNKYVLRLIFVATITLTMSACAGISEIEPAPAPSNAKDLQIATAGSDVAIPESQANASIDEPLVPAISSNEPLASISNSAPADSAGEETNLQSPTSASSAPADSTEQKTYNGLAVDPEASMAQAMTSPDFLACLFDKVGMQTMMELSGRNPTYEEISIMQACL